MDIKKVLLRAGNQNLINLIDDETFKILKLRNTSLTNQKNLINLALQLKSGFEILKNKDSRDIVINALKEKEAFLIAELFNIKSSNPWKKLSDLNFKNKKIFNSFLNIFDIEKPYDSEDNIENNTTNPVEIIPAYSLFPYQIDVMKKAEDYLKAEVKRVIMHMPTGAGKTRTAINLVCDFLKESESLVIWLAHTEELCQQAHDEFNKGWKVIGNKKINSYKLFKNFRHDIDKINSGFLVISLDYAYSLTKKNQSSFFKLARNCKFIVMDEAHMSIAPSYKQVLEILINNKTKLLGLTATPGRAEINSEENEKLAEFYNRQKTTLKIKNYKSPIIYLQDKGYLAKIENIKLETNINIKKIFSLNEIKEQIKRIENGLDLSKDFVKKLSSNEKRTNMIIETAIEENKDSKNKIIIFAGSLESAKNIQLILKLENTNSALITGETNNAQRRFDIEKFKDENSGLNILVNYGVLTTGFDAPKANVAIIGRPTQSVTLYSQMVGRVMRGKNAGGKEFCKVITVKDPIYGFRDMSESFFYWEELWS